ncbi:hypothetical protein NQ318_022601 [Aromia moschata]|uniref:MADF domain-containing protein n=1 Tax=Aromia moschata TaxID=1265417 RepID=A0AAV8XDH3_9CUCU|nr:hypothetical protein NQ318_022601 [Aromia moschata]
MGTFRKLLQKVEASSKTGSGTDEVVKPEWFAYEFMYRFLKGIYLPTETKDSEMLRTEDNETADEKKSGEVTVTEDITNGSQLKPPKAKSIKRKIHLPPDIDQKMDKAYKVFKNVTDTQMPPPDQCSLYGELLATKLRTLDADTREMAMIEIDLLVYRLKHRYNESSQQHFGHLNLQNIPIQSTASFPHNSNQYQRTNFEPVVQHKSRPSSSASFHHSLLSNHHYSTTNSPSPSPLAPILSKQYLSNTLPSAAQQVHIQPTILPSSPPAANYSQHSTTTLISASPATTQNFSSYSNEKETVVDTIDTYENY